jgi:hypothetical protein
VFEGSKSYDFLRPFYSSAGGDKALSTSLDAVSLAFFAHQENANSAVKQGRYRYRSALSQVRRAISCPVAVRKDSTLLATMLLDLYEKINNRNPGFEESWKSHIRGSLTLVELRGTKLFDDHNGFRMLVRLSTNLLISCVVTDTRLPNSLIALQEYESSYLNNKDPKWLLTDLMLSYVNLRQVISKGHLTDRDTIASLIELEASFATVAVNSPNTWQCRRVRLHCPTERVIGDHMDVFLDHHITQTHNVGRLIRILLNELLHDYSSTPAGVGWAYENKELTLRVKTETTTNELVNKICASVPQYTCPELVQNRSLSPCSHASTWSETNSQPSYTRMRIYTATEKVRSYTLIFPMFVAAQSIAATDYQKLWVIGQLHFMASAMGLRNAEVVAKILEAGVKINPWKVYALLGSYAFAA